MARSLDIVINTHNVRDLVVESIASIYKQKGKTDDWRLIVVDMASNDGTKELVQEKFPEVDVVASKNNLGFAKGNNLARKLVNAEYVLFLNPDTKIVGKVIQNTIRVLDERKDIGAVGCRVMLPNGKLDYSCHRGLPTIWNTLSYWSGLAKIFPKSKFFAGYTATYLDYHYSHEIECISGTYLLIRKKVLDKVEWWDEDYFWNGEDIEMCFRIKKLGGKIWYEAGEEILHYKGSSSGLWSTAKVGVPKETRVRSAKSAAYAMRIFIRKHWRELGPAPIIAIVWLGVWLLEKYRLAKLKVGLKYA